MEKWLFCDFDGTLRNGKDGGVDPIDLQFVKGFTNEGNKFVIASGRPYSIMVHEMNDINLKPDLYVTNAGALIFKNDGELIYQKTMPRKYNKKLLDYIESMNLKSLIYATVEGEYYLFTDNPSRFKDGTVKRETVNKPFSYLLDKDLVCFKIIDTREKLDKLIEFVNKELPELTVINNNDTNLVEIHPINSSKANAIKVIQDYYKLDDKQIYVAGDDDNDIQMLDEYENSFCIKQPYNEDVQPHGNHVIDHLCDMKKYL